MLAMTRLPFVLVDGVSYKFLGSRFAVLVFAVVNRFFKI